MASLEVSTSTTPRMFSGSYFCSYLLSVSCLTVYSYCFYSKSSRITNVFGFLEWWRKMHMNTRDICQVRALYISIRTEKIVSEKYLLNGYFKKPMIQNIHQTWVTHGSGTTMWTFRDVLHSHQAYVLSKTCEARLKDVLEQGIHQKKMSCRQ